MIKEKIQNKKKPAADGIPRANADADQSHEISPLEQIRHAEAEVTRRLASARQEAEKKLIKARSKAAQQQKQALDEGLRQGQAHYQSTINKAEEEARQILTESREKAGTLLLQGETHLYEAVCLAVEIILGVEGGGKTNPEHQRRKHNEH